MAFVGASHEFDVDNNGILRDSLSSLIIDDDGIVQDDDLDMYRYVIQGQYTDSGIGGDKQSSTSTLHHHQHSFEDLAPLGDESINISELEASKDDLSFERHKEKNQETEKSAFLGISDSRESTLDKPQDYNHELPIRHKLSEDFSKSQLSEDFSKSQLFSEDYYRQLRDLGVLVDGVDLSRDSLNEFDETESHANSGIYEDDANRKHKNSPDLIGEYLMSVMRKEQQENGVTKAVDDREMIVRRGSDLRVSDSDGRYSQTSPCTISITSFLDEAENFDNLNISQNGSEGHALAQRVVSRGDDITDHALSASPPGIVGRAQLQQAQKKSPNGSRADTPVGQDAGPTIQRHGGLRNLGPVSHSTRDDDARSVHSDLAYPGSRPSSRTSHVSTASEQVSARQKKAEDVAIKRLAKTNSRENFFDEGEPPQIQRERTHQKRILPQPNSVEQNQSFKVKNKNTSNKPGPVKPDHTSDSHVSDPSQPEYGRDAVSRAETLNDMSGYVDESAKELSDRLTQEAQKRKQATELVQQLQKDYGNLLTKYALAELTIDQMRLGARITLHTDSPTPSQAQSAVMSPVLSQQTQVISLQQPPSQGILMTLQAQGMMGRESPLTDNRGPIDGMPLPISEVQRSRSQPDFQRGSMVSLLQSTTRSDGGQHVSQTGVETVKADLRSQIQNMEERLESFCVLLDGGQLTLENQESMFEQIKGDHDVLRRAYLQVKEEYNVLRRSGAFSSDTQNFDQNKELEGHLFRLGMRFDEVHERVENDLKEMSKQRQPFQDASQIDGGEISKNQGTSNKSNISDSQVGSGKAASQQMSHNVILSDSVSQKTSQNVMQSDSVSSSDASKLEQRIHQLREEYNANMDIYRKLKYSSNSPEGERQMEHIVMKLNDICTEMPDMFRLSPEIQSRRDQMQRENRLNINDRKHSVWEKLKKREQTMQQQRMSPVSQFRRGSHSSVPDSPLNERAPIILQQGLNNSDTDSLRARLDGGSSRSSLSSILPDRPSSFGNDRGHSLVDHERPPSRSRTPGEDHSFSDSMSWAHDSSHPSMPRPRRHEHGVRDPKFLQMPNISGAHNLPDNKMPDEEGHVGGTITRDQHQDSQRSGAVDTRDGYDNLEGALAALPGPGKLKQMTKQRAADDADSGFIGSMVGSGVGVHPTQLQQQQKQQQQQQQQQQHLTLKMSTAADESSTLTDQSLDMSTPELEHSRSQQVRDKTDRSGQQQFRASRSKRMEESCDREEDTMEILESDVSLRRGEVDGRTTKRGVKDNEERSKESQGSTLEESYSEESQVSTPRAGIQSQTKPIIKETVSSGKASFNLQTDDRAQTSSSQTQAAAEKEYELGNNKTDKAQLNRPGNLQTSERAGSTRSTSPLPRPPSRGSPTTDLFHSRERRVSHGGRRASGGVIDMIRQKRQAGKEERQYIRQDQPGSRHRSGGEERNASSGSDLSAGFPQESHNPDIAGRVREFEDRSTGSDVEVGSSVTRTSSVASSGRLKALQEEIERLKEGVAKANERASQPPPPPQIYHTPAPAPQEPGYYDPFDDPYGFMRMPRRRANSFSGGREREWDEWYWTLPQNRQYDGGDIPLGYAAADAYADLPVNANPRQQRSAGDIVETRLRHRQIEHRHRGNLRPGESVPVAERGYGQQSHLTASEEPRLTTNQQQVGAGLPDEQTAAMYEHYVPSRYSTSSMRQQMAAQGYFTTPSGAKIYSSTGYLARTSQVPGRPWYQIRRAPQPFTSQTVYREAAGQATDGRRTQSQEDISHWRQAASQYNQYPRSQTSPAMNVGQRTATQLCPMCGGTGSHTHTSHAKMGQSYSRGPPPQYSSHRDPLSDRNSRRQSRSPVHSSGQTHSQSHYRVREYRHQSDSDEEERVNIRSRSLSRGRSRTRSLGRSVDRSYRERSDSQSEQVFGEASLDQSLSLSVDIGLLTKKMLGTVSTELKRAKNEQNFGDLV